jgi:hypothetical protein
MKVLRCGGVGAEDEEAWGSGLFMRRRLGEKEKGLERLVAPTRIDMVVA